MRLHFDGYPECYDFWVNVDSSDIHPVGWCEKTSHKLLPPKGMKKKKQNGVQETINSTKNQLSWLCMFHFQCDFIVELDLSGLKGRGVTKIVTHKRTKQLPFDIPKD